MKRSTLQWGVSMAAALVVIAGTTPAKGQEREFVVDRQVVSDSVAAEGTSSDGYVGDMSMADATGGGSCSSCGRVINRSYGRPDLFFNFYTQGCANRANAQMYLSPLPVPPNVGHTFNTYQPFYPHELLYWHQDRFHNHYDNGRGMNRTKAVYYSPPIRQAASNFYWNYLRLPR